MVAGTLVKILQSFFGQLLERLKDLFFDMLFDVLKWSVIKKIQ